MQITDNKDQTKSGSCESVKKAALAAAPDELSTLFSSLSKELKKRGFASLYILTEQSNGKQIRTFSTGLTKAKLTTLKEIVSGYDH